MARKSTKPPAARLSDWGATGGSVGKRRWLTRAQYAELRRQLADVDDKLRQLGAAEARRRVSERWPLLVPLPEMNARSLAKDYALYFLRKSNASKVQIEKD